MSALFTSSDYSHMEAELEKIIKQVGYLETIKAIDSAWCNRRLKWPETQTLLSLARSVQTDIEQKRAKRRKGNPKCKKE